MKKFIFLLCIIIISVTFFSCKGGKETKYYQISFVLGETTYTTEVKEGEMPTFLGSTALPADENFIYRIGETVEVKNFDCDRSHECAPGIHFFITRQEAVDYNVVVIKKEIK